MTSAQIDAVTLAIKTEIVSLMNAYGSELRSFAKESGDVFNHVVLSTAEGNTDQDHLLSHANARIAQLAAIHAINAIAIQREAVAKTLAAVLAAALAAL